MSGDHWEVVTKSKKDKQQNGAPRKLTKTEKKKFIENAPKVEDLLPLSQVKTLYAAGFDKEKKPVDTKAKSKENDLKKAQQKKSQQQQKQQAEKPKEKENKPRTIDAAMGRITLEEFNDVVHTAQARFKDTPLVWLKSIGGYFDAMLNVEHPDPVFSTKNHEYPLCLMPSSIRNSLKEALQLAGEGNLQAFYEILITSLAHEMSKGSSGLGTKVVLQFIATQYPKITLNAIPKCVSMQNSYQNRKPIWLSVLWAMGQAGFRDLAVGFKVWEEVMVPVVEMRNYSQFVVEYVTRLLGRHAAGPALSVNQYLSALDAMFSSHHALPNQVADSLHRQARVLRKIAVNATPDAKLHLFFQPLMERLRLSGSDAYKKELLEFLYVCLSVDQQCFATWKQLYPKNIPQSAALLRHIDATSKQSGFQIAQKPFKSLMNDIMKTNAPLLSSKPKTEGLQDCQTLCQSLSKNMAVKKTSHWKLYTFVILLMLGGALFYDINLHGSFKSSSTGRFLKDTGALHYGELGLEQVKIYTRKGILWTQENGPHYYAVTVEYSKPYVELLRDMSIIVFNGLSRAYVGADQWVRTTAPIVDAWCTEKAPGVTEKVKEYGAVAADGAKYCFFEGVKYAKIGIASAGDFAAKNVFVGKLSPENLNKYTIEAVNTTQTYAKWTYQWILQQVDIETSSKVH